MRLTWCTDIHLDFLGREGVARFVEELASEAPDAVAITGDLSVASSLAAHLKILAGVLERPIYFVLGNHDYYGSSIAEVRRGIVELCEGDRWLDWVSEGGARELTPRAALVGHDAWADMRLGTPERVRVRMRDWAVIEELTGLDDATRAERLRALGREAAAHLRRVLPAALERYEQVFVLTHPPPFASACRFRGRRSPDHWLPILACGAAGDVLTRAAESRPDRRIEVLSGHTHGRADEQIRPNLRARVGAAEYRSPRVAATIVVR